MINILNNSLSNTFLKTTLQLILKFILVLALSSCGSKVEIVSALPEGDANEVLGVLLNAGVDAHKIVGKAGVSVFVDQSSTALAIDILRQQGLPHEKRSKMGDVFKKENLISSPLEERARYLYALSQELEQTLSQVDGVVMARVHVVLPDRVAPGEPTIPSSASVFLKYQPGFGVENVVSQVNLLVANSIPGLAQEKVTVAMVPATVNKNAAPSMRLDNVLFFRVEHGSATSLRILLATLFVTMLLSAGIAVYFSLSNEKFSRSSLGVKLVKLTGPKNKA